MLRDPDRMERWGCGNLMKLNKTKCKILQLGQGTSTGWEEKGLGSPKEKDLGVMIGSSRGPSHVSSHPRKPNMSWAESREMSPAGRGR